MSLKINRVVFYNRAPFKRMEIAFQDKEIAVLSAINGKGKTTVISHIIDAFIEIARPYFPQEYEGRETKFYRISTDDLTPDKMSPSIFFMELSVDGQVHEYIDVRKPCDLTSLSAANLGNNLISNQAILSHLDNGSYVKFVSPGLDKGVVEKLFHENIITYFPSYRYEMPGFLTDPFKIKNEFRVGNRYTGYLPNPLEVPTGLPKIANWIMDVILDQTLYSESTVVKEHINKIISLSISTKDSPRKRIGVGSRNFGSTRIQILNASSNQSVYPSIFHLSSGEASLICMFCELIRQGDNIKQNASLQEFQGVVLIDEVDKHLHIRMQKEALPELLNMFPNVQFILSSHAPFLNIGLAEVAGERSRIIDLDNNGVSIPVEKNGLYQEVYELMISENQRFKTALEEIQRQTGDATKLQILTEGHNAAVIKKAIEVLDKHLLNQISIVQGIEGKTGEKQLKVIFQTMSKANHAGKFLYIWDCDSKDVVQPLVESANHFKHCFDLNGENKKVKRGIENLFGDHLLGDDVYNTTVVDDDMGGKHIDTKLDKSKFLRKVLSINDPAEFKNFGHLVERIKSLLAAQ